MAMQTEQLVVSRIIIDRGAPPVDEATVVALVESMGKVGLLNPITVWRPSGVMPELIAGRHRLEAAKRLGWDAIDAYVMEGSDRDPAAAITAQIAFVDENLIRRDIGDAERAHLVARRKELYEVQHPETVLGANQHSGRVRQFGEPNSKNADRFTAATAKATKRSERSVQRDARRGEVLGADAARIAGTSLDKGVELDALASMPPEQRASLINRAAAGEKVSARAPARRARPPSARQGPPALPKPKNAGETPALRKLKSAWTAAGDDDRAEFLSWIKT